MNHTITGILSKCCNAEIYSGIGSYFYSFGDCSKCELKTGYLSQDKNNTGGYYETKRKNTR